LYDILFCLSEMSSTTATLLEPLTGHQDVASTFIPIHTTIDDLLRSYAAENVETPLVAYPVKGVSDFEEYTANDLDRFADAAVARYIGVGIEPAVRVHSIPNINHCMKFF
jgi:hypothetical protein